MPNDLISRETAIKMIRENGIRGEGYSREEREDNLVDMLECLPAVDAAPVVDCEFERLEETKFPTLTVTPLRCGTCGAEFAVLFKDMPGKIGFCPNCGAKRKEEEK